MNNEYNGVPIKMVGVDVNGHIFTKETLEKMLDDVSKTHVYLGELGQTNIKGTCNLENVAISTTNIRMSDDMTCVIGDVKVLETPKGKILSDIINNSSLDAVGCFGARSYGEVTRDGNVTNAKLISVDFCEGLVRNKSVDICT